ncbi:MAG: hypothetical protein PHI12_12195 [Dehalococcoidales bacterium]|nr:hypothetical protein [Dehalococcoidales bacterium]
MSTQLVGYSIEDLGLALDVMEQQTPVGGTCRVEICTEDTPTPEMLQQMYESITATGHEISYPTCERGAWVTVTSFDIKKSEPYEIYQWQLLLPLIIPLAAMGLVTFGILKIDTISKAIVPIVLIVGGVLIISLALLQKPATKYLERGGKIPMLPDVKKRGKLGKPTRDDVEIHTWQERDRAHVEIRDKRNDETVMEWWDEAVSEMFEDGFFKGGMPREHWWGSESPSGEFEKSVLDYAESMGALAKGSHAMTYRASTSPKA